MPVAILVTLACLLRTELVFFLTVFIVPFSINFEQTPMGIGVNVPTEPVTFGLMLILFFKMIMDGGIDKKILKHPVSVLILLHLVWMIFTTFFSELPVVSVKFTLGRICFVTVFYFYSIQLFYKANNISKFMWLYVISLMLVIFYTIYNQALENFTELIAHSAMTPFYYDHTQYAAMIALFLPVILAFLTGGSYSKTVKTAAFVTVTILFTGLVLSYTRAAWASCVAAFACSLIFLFRVHTTLVYAALVSFLVFMAINISSIMLNLETNKEASSTDLASHIQSAFNTTTDASNVERINRWNCAIRMFKERPVLGWGVGTYQFVYGPFQLNREITYISTNQGNRGNAHSEYLTPLSEQGLPGSLLFIAIAIATLFTASRFIVNAKSVKLRALAIGLIVGLITYWVHGFLNNFLHTEKASIPYWAFIGAIAALRIYHQNTTDEDLAKKGF